MSVRSLACMLLLAGSAPAHALQSPGSFPDLFQLEPGHSSVLFTARFLRFVHVAGRFTQFHGALIYDSTDPGHSSVATQIQVASLTTDNDLRDKHLKSPDFLDAEKYPAITFRSTHVSATKAGFVAEGDLTIHGVTRKATVPFQRVLEERVDERGNAELAFVGQVTLNRRDFGVVGGNQFNPAFDLAESAVGDSIEVTLNVFAIRFGPQQLPYGNRVKPSIGQALDSVAATRGGDAAVSRYRELKTAHPDAYNFNERELNVLGYRLLAAGKPVDALAILRLNAEQFPNSSNAYDSMGEAYARFGDRANAVTSYHKSLELDPGNTNAVEMLAWLVEL